MDNNEQTREKEKEEKEMCVMLSKMHRRERERGKACHPTRVVPKEKEKPQRVEAG